LYLPPGLGGDGAIERVARAVEAEEQRLTHGRRERDNLLSNPRYSRIECGCIEGLIW
jgi:hypothetical protein